MTTTKTVHFTDTKEYYDLRSQFEKRFSNYRLDREPKALNKKRRFYENGETNKLFLAFLDGYQLGRFTYMN